MSRFMLGSDVLPSGFVYPSSFDRIVRLGLTNLEPWFLLHGQALEGYYEDLKRRYPSRILIPFAARIDNDDVACWSPDEVQRVLIIHDFASPGWEQRQKYDSLYDWLRSAIEDLIDHDPPYPFTAGPQDSSRPGLKHQ